MAARKSDVFFHLGIAGVVVWLLAVTAKWITDSLLWWHVLLGPAMAATTWAERHIQKNMNTK